MSFWVKMHSTLTLHSDNAMSRALVIKATIALVRKINLIYSFRIFFIRFPTTWPLSLRSANQKQKCCNVDISERSQKMFKIPLTNCTHNLHTRFHFRSVFVCYWTAFAASIRWRISFFFKKAQYISSQTTNCKNSSVGFQYAYARILMLQFHNVDRVKFNTCMDSYE